MKHALPDRLRYLDPVRKQLAALKPDDIHEDTDLSVLRRVVRKRLKGLSDDEARSQLLEDTAELERWLSKPGSPDSRLNFILPILPDAIEILLTQQPHPPPERGEASIEVPEDAKVTVEKGTLSVRWRRFWLSVYPSHREDMHSHAGRWKDDAKSQPMSDSGGISIEEVKFGSVSGIKCISQANKSKIKRVDYALDVPGGYMVVVLQTSRGDFDESAIEQYFHTLRVLNYPPPAPAQESA